MKNVILTSTILLGSLSLASASYACDMHGAGYSGFGFRNADWQPYNPKVSTIDPALSDIEALNPGAYEAVPPAKTKPSFSNVANLAAAKAKARLAKKADDKTPNEKAALKKTALNADR